MHFSLAIITEGKPTYETIEKIMEPYSEDNEHELEFTPLSDRDVDYYMEECKETLSLEEVDFDKFYQYMLSDMGYEYDPETNKFGYYDNPNTRWDFWCEGGKGLIVPNGKEHFIVSNPKERYGELLNYLEFSSGACKMPIPDDYSLCYSARIKDLVMPDDLKAKIKRYYSRLWEVLVEGSPFVGDEEAKQYARQTQWYNRDWYLHFYKTKQYLIDYETSMFPFPTNSLITKDGEWHCIDEYNNWFDVFQRLAFKDVGDNDYITLIDCHI